MGHSRITTLAVGDQTLDMISDHMKIKYSFSKPFRVVIPNREEWSEGRRPLPRCELEWYTDGSKTRESSGAGICGGNPRQECVLPMGEHPTVFQTEITAQINKKIKILNNGLSLFLPLALQLLFIKLPV
ncbi:hypothetical protein CE195_02190 [Sodalis-like symbiont of Philaenus spumarius]|nr:hypothetical protein CE195_02190 [Sodalis-like symbiont of Philaenus spumarius]